MLSDVVNLLKFLFDLLRGRQEIASALSGKRERGVLHLYFLLDEIIESSGQLLDLLESGSEPEVRAELKARDTNVLQEIRGLVKKIAQNTQRFLEQLDSFSSRLGIYLPQLPKELRLAMHYKAGFLQWWIEILDRDRAKFADLPITRHNNHLAIMVYADSIIPESLARHPEDVRRGRQNLDELQMLRHELRNLIRANCDIKEVLGL